MSNVTIFISLKSDTKKLHLEDSEGHSGNATDFFTDVRRGDTVTWQLAQNSGIDEITGIIGKDGNFNIFANNPKKKNNGSWVGKVKNDAAGSESYNIQYIISGVFHSEDPEIRVKQP